EMEEQHGVNGTVLAAFSGPQPATGRTPAPALGGDRAARHRRRRGWLPLGGNRHRHRHRVRGGDRAAPDHRVTPARSPFGRRTHDLLTWDTPTVRDSQDTLT